MSGCPWRWRSAHVVGLRAVAWCFLILFGLGEAQNTSSAKTAPWEAAALNSILRQWGLSVNTESWITPVDPCTGAALGDSTPIEISAYDPFIKCDCTSDNGTTCHIIGL
ncbi:hypothetical protein Ancab_001567 [Ancistrocladus abbreviatus]